MDHNPPTTADYAWSDARQANKKVEELEHRVKRLEDWIALLHEEIVKLKPEK